MYKTPVLWSIFGLFFSIQMINAQADTTVLDEVIEDSVEIIEEKSLEITLEDLQSSSFSGCIPGDFEIVKTKLGRNIAAGDYNRDGIQDLVALVQTPPNRKTIKLVIFERDTAGLCPNLIESLNFTPDLVADETFSQVKTYDEDQIYFKFHSEKYNIEIYLAYEEETEQYSITRSTYIIHPSVDFPKGEIVSKNFKEGIARVMPKEGSRKQVIEERIPARPIPLASVGKDELKNIIKMD